VPDVAHDVAARKPRREVNPGTSSADTKRDHRAEEQRTSRSARAAASSSRRSLREGDCNAGVNGYGFKPGLLHHDAAAVADAPDDAAGRKLNDRCRTRTVFLNLCRESMIECLRLMQLSLPLHFQPLQRLPELVCRLLLDDVDLRNHLPTDSNANRIRHEVAI
jgi:hypothetical protein